ncbi:MAG: sporulation protein YqfD [Clostridiales bacterium]|jgi:similar to stage IV sporulation protein|nr:sporulation protein YqfD [Clostridiales bacterium]
MVLGIWNYLRGYVTVEVAGFSAERFVNLAAKRGVYLWDAERPDGGALIFNVSVKGFRALKGCARKSGCKFKIKDKRGLPFVLYRYRKRKALLGGIIFFIAALYTLTSFVWQIEVKGNERISRDDIVAYCESAGLKTGAFKHTLNAKGVREGLLRYFTDITWADVHIKGTRATVTLSETIPKQEIIDRKTPCDIVAAKDGLITGIVAGAGKPLVKVNDVVKAGEVLVSGKLEMNSDLNGQYFEYVHSYAEVWARRYTEISFSVPLNYTEKAYTGRETSRRSVELLFAGGKLIHFPGSSIPFENYDKITKHKQIHFSKDYPLPVILVTEVYTEFIAEARERTVEDAKALAERMITNRILNEFEFEADILEKRAEYEELPGELRVKALIITNERIDKEAPVNNIF